MLAIAAARLGFGPVTALDSEPAAVEATLRERARQRRRAGRVERLDLRREPAPAADVVTANLVRPLLLRVAELMERPARER